MAEKELIRFEDFFPSAPEMAAHRDKLNKPSPEERKRNRYQLCHRPDGQPGLPLVEYDYDREK